MGFDFLVTANNAAEISASYTSALQILNNGAATFSNSITALSGIFGNSGSGSYSLRIANNDQSNVRLNIVNSGSGGQEFSIIGGLAGASNAGFSIYDNTNASTRFYINSTGVIALSNLAGTGTRMVVADASGNLSTQAIGSGSITGSGTTNYVPKFTSSSAIGNSVIIDSGSDVTVGNALRVNAFGNVAGGTIRMGAVNDGTEKWSYLVSTQYNSSSNPQGFSVIGAYTTATANQIVIGGSIYEANPATEIQFWTHTATTHATGGSKRMTIDTHGNVGINTATPSQKFEVSGGAIIASGFGNRAAGTGKALEIGMDGTSAVLQALDRTANAFIPIAINSSGAIFNNSVTAGAFLANGTTVIGIPIDTGGAKAYFDASGISGSALALRADSVGRTIRMTSDGTGSSVGAIDINSSGLNIGTNTSHPIIFRPVANIAMQLFTDGNVFIGSSPSNAGFRLDVVSPSAPIAKFTGATNGYIDITDGTVNSRIQNSGGLFIGTVNAYDFNLRTNATTRLNFNATTGLATFSNSLQVNGGSRLIGSATVGGDTAQWVLAGVANGGAIFQKSHSGAGGFDDRYLRLGNIDNNGTPNYVLTVFNNGVGIGTTNPIHTLDVNGTVRVNGSNPAYRTDNTDNYTSLVSWKSGVRGWQLDNVNNDFWLYMAATANVYALKISSTSGAATFSNSVAAGTTINWNGGIGGLSYNTGVVTM